MPAVRECVICSKPLDDGHRRRADAVTCSASCRTLLWRARKRARANGDAQYPDVTVDGSGSAARFRLRDEDSWAESDERFHRQAALDDAAVTPTRAERAWERRNPGIRHPAVQQRIIEVEVARRLREADDYAARVVYKPQDAHDPSSTGIGRLGRESRRLNRPAPPGMRSGPRRNTGSALEAEMTDAPWNRHAPRDY